MTHDFPPLAQALSTEPSRTVLYVRELAKVQIFPGRTRKFARSHIANMATLEEGGVFPFHPSSSGRRTVLQRDHTTEFFRSHCHGTHAKNSRTEAKLTGGSLLLVGVVHHIFPFLLLHFTVPCPSPDFSGSHIATFLPNQGTCNHWIPSHHRHRTQGGPECNLEYNCVSAT